MDREEQLSAFRLSYDRVDSARLSSADCLRRHLQGLPVTERTDFERV